MIGSSTVLYALTVSTFIVSATSVPISGRTTNKLHFFSGNCSDPEVQRQIKEQFIQLLNDSVFNVVCQADTLRDRCKADNVKVTCYSETRRRRSLSGEFIGYFLLRFNCASFSGHRRTKVIVKNHLVITFIVKAISNKAGALFLGFYL